VHAQIPLITEVEVVSAIRQHLEGLFPKVCSNCRRVFGTFRDYLLITKPIGPTMSFDVQFGDWRPVEPLGTATYANCPCGNTLVLTSEGMPLRKLWPLMNWARIETESRGQTVEELLTYLREEIRKQVVGAPDLAST
jgi:hypothetical protein